MLVPRGRRRWIPGAGAHLISRFVDRRFHLGDDVDREVLLESITRANQRWDWTWLSYALMSSHIHYGLIAGSIAPDRFLRSTHTRYAQRFHRRHQNRTLGPVFADRPNLHSVSSGRLQRLVAYHHRNPVEAGVVTRPRDSTWTSHRAYLRLDPPPVWLDVEHGLFLLGFDDTETGRCHFDHFVTEIDLKDWRPLDGSRRSDAHPVSIEDATPAVDWSRLITAARKVAGVPVDVPIDSRNRRAACARKLISIIATRDLGQTYRSVAEQLGTATGSVFNMVARTSSGRTIEPRLDELRRLLE